MIFFVKKKAVDLPVGGIIPPLTPVDLRQRIKQAFEDELKPLGFSRNNDDIFVRQRGNVFEDEFGVSFDNTKQPLIGVSPFCGVSLPQLRNEITHLVGKNVRTVASISQNLGYVCPEKSLAIFAATPELGELSGYYASPNSFATFWFPLDREPEPMAIHIARNFQTYGIPFCESINSYDDVLNFIGKTDPRDMLRQFKKAALHLMAGRREIGLQIVFDTVRDLEQRALTDTTYAAPALKQAKKMLAWFETR